MEEIIFYFGKEIILVKVDGKNVLFGNSTYGAKLAPIDGLKLSKQGAIKEFPDLKDRDDWKEESIKRFKDHIASLKNESEVSQYIISDLRKFGYIPKFIQKAGFRPIRI